MLHNLLFVSKVFIFDFAVERQWNRSYKYTLTQILMALFLCFGFLCSFLQTIGFERIVLLLRSAKYELNFNFTFICYRVVSNVFLFQRFIVFILAFLNLLHSIQFSLTCSHFCCVSCSFLFACVWLHMLFQHFLIFFTGLLCNVYKTQSHNRNRWSMIGMLFFFFNLKTIITHFSLFDLLFLLFKPSA